MIIIRYVPVYNPLTIFVIIDLVVEDKVSDKGLSVHYFLPRTHYLDVTACTEYSTYRHYSGTVAQWLNCPTFRQYVWGSNPTLPTLV